MDTTQIGDATIVGAILGVLGIVLLFAWLVPTIFFLLTLQKALNRVAPERRTMNPPMVWLSLIPLFNLVWNFMVVLALSKSLGAEFAFRKIPGEAEPGKTFGLIWAGLMVACMIPGISVLAALPVLVMWIVYWVKIAGLSGQLAGPAPGNPM